MDDLPSQLAVKVGQAHTLRLAGKGTAGYIWTCDVSGDSESVSVSRRTEPPAPGVESKMVGFSADELFDIRGLSAGRATLTLALRRPWERNRPPLEDHVVHVAVE